MPENKIGDRLSSAFSELSSAQQQLQFVRQKLEHQQQLLQAMWELLKDRLDCSESELRARLETVRQAHRDRPREAPACRTCGRALQAGSTVCIYCGAEGQEQALF